jgi:KEOPS complex subunit Pcc1
MIHRAVFRIETCSTPILFQAISPESDDDFSGRSQCRCRMSAENILEISLYASDLPALRAALNTWLRLIQVASEMIDRTQI